MTIEELAEKLGIELNDDNKSALATYVSTITKGLKDNRDELRADVQRLRDAAKAFEGVDLAAIREAADEADIDLSDIPDRIRTRPASGETEDQIRSRIEADVAKKHQRELDREKKRGDDATARADRSDAARIKTAKDNALLAAVTAKKGNAKLLLPVLGGRVKAEINDSGDVVLTPLAANGDPLESEAGGDGTIEDLVETFRRDDDYAAAFAADGVPGGGAKGGPGSRNGGKNPFKPGPHFNRTEQASLRKTDPALARSLEEAAQ